MVNIKTTSVREKEREDEQLFMGGSGGGREYDDPREEEDEEGDDQQEASHAQFLSDIMKITKRGKVRQDVRTSLGASTVDTSSLLTRFLPSTSLRKNRHTHTLPLPVEKTVARRIKRSAGYENVAMEVNKWAKVVKVRREAEQLQFPLKNNEVSLKTVDKTEVVQRRTPLEQEVYSLLQGAKLVQGRKETEEEQVARKAVSLQEIRERNRELWRQKEMKRRYEQKARLMNKSKSRKHHRLLRRERIKKQKAELEELQKTDPEAALERLEELERVRIEERMSLRHKTSKWAQLQGLRATRDKNAMAALRENQRMHQELTSKVTKPGEDEEEELSDAELNTKVEGEAAVQDIEESDNPWIKNLHSTSVLKNQPEDESFTRFKKFWEEVNKRKQVDQQIEEQLEQEKEQKEIEEQLEKEKEQEKVEDAEIEEEIDSEEKGEEEEEEKEEEGRKQTEMEEKERKSEDNEDNTTKKSIKKKNKKKLTKPLVNSNQEAVTLDDLFDEVEIGIKNKVNKKLKKMGIDKEEPWIEVKTKKKYKQTIETNAPPEIEEFDFTSVRNQENLDERKERATTLQDLEGIEGERMDKLQEAVHTLKDSAGASSGTPHKPKLQVDPNKFLQVEARRLVTALPDSVGEAGEAMDDQELKEETAEDIMREAFADDYLMEEFSSEKAEAIKRDQPGGMSLALPGWGDWTGPNIKMSNTKIKKYRLRVPHVARKDSNIGNVLYNEKADVHTNLRKAMVAELPYPFKSVKEFEASVRAPVGRLFVPEAAHKRMTAPPIVTKMGTVIQPMTDNELLRHEAPTKGENRQDQHQGGRKRKGTADNLGKQNTKRKFKR